MRPSCHHYIQWSIIPTIKIWRYCKSFPSLLENNPSPLLKSMIIYRMAKSKSVESPYCSTSATSKASWGQWWKFELLTESLVWYPGKIIGWESPVWIISVLASNSAGSVWIRTAGGELHSYPRQFADSRGRLKKNIEKIMKKQEGQ